MLANYPTYYHQDGPDFYRTIRLFDFKTGEPLPEEILTHIFSAPIPFRDRLARAVVARRLFIEWLAVEFPQQIPRF